jgi:hypothetical protein
MKTQPKEKHLYHVFFKAKPIEFDFGRLSPKTIDSLCTSLEAECRAEAIAFVRIRFDGTRKGAMRLLDELGERAPLDFHPYSVTSPTKLAWVRFSDALWGGHLGFESLLVLVENCREFNDRQPDGFLRLLEVFARSAANWRDHGKTLKLMCVMS